MEGTYFNNKCYCFSIWGAEVKTRATMYDFLFNFLTEGLLTMPYSTGDHVYLLVHLLYVEQPSLEFMVLRSLLQKCWDCSHVLPQPD